MYYKRYQWLLIIKDQRNAKSNMYTDAEEWAAAAMQPLVTWPYVASYKTNNMKKCNKLIGYSQEQRLTWNSKTTWWQANNVYWLKPNIGFI